MEGRIKQIVAEIVRGETRNHKSEIRCVEEKINRSLANNVWTNNELKRLLERVEKLERRLDNETGSNV